MPRRLLSVEGDRPLAARENQNLFKLGDRRGVLCCSRDDKVGVRLASQLSTRRETSLALGGSQMRFGI